MHAKPAVATASSTKTTNLPTARLILILIFIVLRNAFVNPGSGRTASAVIVTGSAVRRAAAPPHRGLLRTAKSRGCILGFYGGEVVT